MKRVLVNLSDDMHEDLRQLAFEKGMPVARLVRFAIDKTFEDELDAIAATRALQEHLKDPSGSMTIEEYMESRGIELPNRASSKTATRARRAAS